MRNCSTTASSSWKTSTEVPLCGEITTRLRCGVSLMLSSGSPSAVCKKLPSLSEPTERSTLPFSSFCSGLGWSLIEILSGGAFPPLSAGWPFSIVKSWCAEIFFSKSIFQSEIDWPPSLLVAERDRGRAASHRFLRGEKWCRHLAKRR